MAAEMRKRRTGGQTSDRTRKSAWSRVLDVVIIVSLLATAAMFTWSGAVGSLFTMSRRDGSTLSRESAALSGKVPFVADQLLWFPAALACVALLVLIYFTGTALRFWVLLVSGAVAMFAVCSACLTLEIIWVSTGVPYTNYEGLYATWSDTGRYLWPILALSVCMVMSLAVTVYGVRRLRACSNPEVDCTGAMPG